MQQTQFVTCPVCKGYGRHDTQKICNECGGIGLGTFIKNDFLYWGYHISPATIIVRHSRRVFNVIVLIVLGMAGMSGVGALLYWAYTYTVVSSGYTYLGGLLTFWSVRDPLLLWFWLGILATLFAYVRLWRERERQLPVRLLRYWQRQRLQRQIQHIPNNWRELKGFRTRHDVSRSYDDALLSIVEHAYLFAQGLGNQELLPIHVLATLLHPPRKLARNSQTVTSKDFLSRLDIYEGKVLPKLKNILEDIPKTASDSAVPLRLSRELVKCLVEGYLSAQEHAHQRVAALDIMTALFTHDTMLTKLRTELGITLPHVDQVATWLAQYPTAHTRRSRRERHKLGRSLQRATRSVATPVLNYFCTDITERARSGHAEPRVARTALLDEIYRFVEKGERQIVIVGEPGVGRYSLIEYVADAVVRDDVPTALRNKRLLCVDADKLASANAEMSAEKKLAVIAAEAALAGDVILVIREGTSAQGEVLRTQTPRLRVFMTMATAPSAASTVFNVSAPTNHEVCAILSACTPALELKYKVYYSYQALVVAAQAATSLFTGKEMLPRACAALAQAVRQRSASDGRLIDGVAVAKAIATMTNVPYTKVLKFDTTS